ncbi:diaminopimelate dehydrogenase [Paenibacillus apiarius]|uniref:Meso-diaminopimelate D-dehydrogenase n=1 Tax=Paenibacillus apiarius TaxID=46240 RepID=A0ABT4DPV2_9BACL|nr:diaminopimelate dehydrogenase [Paenibacillus apiarius]MCY9515544.1 diaminopimelate dehydrogenase [Paenibacillus apiarius]MCY9519383.1 diaminopimelate dehydrogenase [Paenibacillus apiarius]MCY9551019.1 diaminopimelate dehydrogenase [Paenibacillus apiarius]MCY9558889.1 diaminopimelate dehydrogenase [Paenibacillus apiarius]MCY9685569.1 diaminopimelate dehydrogenase [Paenibacillus apiarius]
MTAIRIGIVGYGNLGKGVEKSIRQNSDMELVAIFTRRDPQSIQAKVPVVSLDEAESYKGKVDVMILCGGSATDLPEQGPQLARMFHTVDSFDTHARIPEYFESVNSVAAANGHISVISTGWDPGLFSLNRLLFQSILPEGNEYTFWGRGVSQGHSDAIRRVEGVKNGVQYTIPSEEAVAQVRAGQNPKLGTRDKHVRECFVVAEAGADQARIEAEIKSMPNYFADYDTIVHFISEEELKANHSAMPHGGLVFRSGVTGEGTSQIMEFGLNLGSNPEFTASVLVAYARAVYKLAARGESGARTVFDIPFGLMSPKSPEQLRKELL